ncbi:glutamine amidotransferase-related protein [Ruegeria marina]|uniref:GMP synthase (Glutamine-hydrolysing) n=1 Tax=Ruegeria marina TaxID=639004 RepID=A0A1G6UML2_9RHOB|nr:glutamine amidotransferase [Ruegeria marina]SDD42553.1 GMP synthase (glutamine-hydrolysing) [Ruegeria marina]
MASRVLSVRHGDEPLDDRATAWLGQAGYDVQTLRPFRGDLLGEPDEGIAATIIYGGPFNVYETDRHPFLNEEYRWIDACLTAGIPVLGICQGCQMIAHHLGAWAGPRDVEIFEFGYYPITPTPEAAGFLDAPLVVTQAHYHTFDLPQGAVRLAGNSNYENQAFRYGDRTFGLQFHAEVTKTGFRRWQEQKRDAYTRPGVQTRQEQDRLMEQHDAAQEAWFHGFLASFMGDVR